MKIAVEGCAHGELEKIYDTIAALESENSFKIDLLICCGDFQATRNRNDLECMAVPDKYKDICTFYKYYSGEKTAHVLTIIIGGNHEASNYFQELALGGWVAPNIYYLGYAGVIQVANIRIAGISGIYKGRDYYKGRYETTPYSKDAIRSCYHIRAVDIFRLKQLTKPVDVMLSHDWPRGIHKHGDVDNLLRRKPFFREDIESNCLGSEPAAELLEEMKPSHWFAAHLHVKFPALVHHSDGSTTKFLALDKCLPRRQFLQVIDIPHEGDVALKYDVEWLTILRLTNHLVSVKNGNMYLPGPGSDERWKFTPTEGEKEETRKRLFDDLTVPLNFVETVPAFNSSTPLKPKQPRLQINPQTSAFCERLGIIDPLSLLLQNTTTSNDISFNDSSTDFEYSSFQVSTDLEKSDNLGTPDKCSSLRTSLIRTPLNLPPPTSFSSPISPDSEHKRPSSSYSPHSETDSTDSAKKNNDSLDPAEPKKFRRRNQAIYASTDT